VVGCLAEQDAKAEEHGEDQGVDEHVVEHPGYSPRFRSGPRQYWNQGI